MESLGFGQRNPDETIDMVVESDNELQELVNPGNDGAEGKDDDVEVVEPSSAEGAPSSNKASVGRGVNFTPEYLKSLLDDYDSMNGKKNHSAFCRHIRD